MATLIFCAIVWLVVLSVIPFERLRVIGIVAVVGFIWMVFVDNISAALGYYSYHNSLLAIGSAPVFQNIAEGGLGILMINWLRENSFTKLLAVLLVGFAFSALHFIYSQGGAFSFGRFDSMLNLIHHIAALSIFVWLSLGVIGEQRVYSGHKSRISRKQTA